MADVGVCVGVLSGVTVELTTATGGHDPTKSVYTEDLRVLAQRQGSCEERHAPTLQTW